MNRIKAIIGQLAASVNSGLNAVLTPADCRDLLFFIDQITKQRRKGKAMDSIVDIGLSALEELKDEILDQFRKR